MKAKGNDSIEPYKTLKAAKELNQRQAYRDVLSYRCIELRIPNPRGYIIEAFSRKYYPTST